jgi:hypothetical protein
MNVVRAMAQNGKNFAKRALWLTPELGGARLTQNEIRVSSNIAPCLARVILWRFVRLGDMIAFFTAASASS